MPWQPEHSASVWLHRTATRCIDADRRWALALHRATARPAALMVLRAVSWLGDGPLWYATMLALPLVYGWSGWPCTLQMISVGGINVAIYLCIKRGTGRPRPHVACPDIRKCARSLDQFSFPSGHTLHAVAYAIVIASHYPPAGPALWAFAVLVAISRVVLGLHYPSDVAAGSIIGAVVASAVLAWP